MLEPKKLVVMNQFDENITITAFFNKEKGTVQVYGANANDRLSTTYKQLAIEFAKENGLELDPNRFVYSHIGSKKLLSVSIKR